MQFETLAGKWVVNIFMIMNDGISSLRQRIQEDLVALLKNTSNLPAASAVFHGSLLSLELTRMETITTTLCDLRLSLVPNDRLCNELGHWRFGLTYFTGRFSDYAVALTDNAGRATFVNIPAEASCHLELRIVPLESLLSHLSYSTPANIAIIDFFWDNTQFDQVAEFRLAAAPMNEIEEIRVASAANDEIIFFLESGAPTCTLQLRPKSIPRSRSLLGCRLEVGDLHVALVSHFNNYFHAIIQRDQFDLIRGKLMEGEALRFIY